MSDLPKFVHLKEEGPREGFQIEKGPISTDRKVELIDALSETGLRQIVVCSFVNPKVVPQMADADEIVRRIRRKPGVKYTGVWLNEKGLERAKATGVLDIAGTLVLTASETFLKRNQNSSFEHNLAETRRIAENFAASNIPVTTVSIASAFGCNFDGDIPLERVLGLLDAAFGIARDNQLDPERINLMDTMGWATPAMIKKVVGKVRERFPAKAIGLHLHDTRGMGIANAYAGVEMGVSSLDACVGGLGGCPFAGNKAAAGNVCTEDLVFMLNEMGIESGVDLDRLIEAALLAEDIVGHPLPGQIKMGGNLDRLRERAVAARATAATA
jgi:hydroxymethylglutaryl-CoA lyase